MSIEASELVDELIYINYAHNRTVSPTTTPEQWKKVYGAAADLMEARYRLEQRP